MHGSAESQTRKPAEAEAKKAEFNKAVVGLRLRLSETSEPFNRDLRGLFLKKVADFHAQWLYTVYSICYLVTTHDQASPTISRGSCWAFTTLLKTDVAATKDDGLEFLNQSPLYLTGLHRTHQRYQSDVPNSDRHSFHPPSGKSIFGQYR